MVTETISIGKQDLRSTYHSPSVSGVLQAIEAVLRAQSNTGSSRRKRVEKAEDSAILFSGPRGNPRPGRQRLSETAGSGLASTACRCRQHSFGNWGRPGCRRNRPSLRPRAKGRRRSPRRLSTKGSSAEVRGVKDHNLVSAGLRLKPVRKEPFGVRAEANYSSSAAGIYLCERLKNPGFEALLSRFIWTEK